MKILSGLMLILMPFAAMADSVVPADSVKNSVNIRAAAVADAEIIGQLKGGDALQLVGSVDGWNEVLLEDGSHGFVSSDWTTVLEEEDVPEAGQATGAAAVAAAPEVAAGTVERDVADIVEEAVAGPSADVVTTVAEEAIDDLAEDAETHSPDDVAHTNTVGPADTGSGSASDISIDGAANYVARFRSDDEIGRSQIYDDGNRVGIGTTEPEQRLEVNGNIQIHERNSSVAGLMITQSSGDTGYIMHNRASTLTIGAGSRDRITIDREGNVGIGVSRPEHPLEMTSGAYVSAGGVWTNRSSRADKENINSLSTDAATAAIMQLEPVTFRYRNEQGETYVGFVAEDVPPLLTTADGQSLSAMDVVAALTKVVQAQQRRIEALEARLASR